MSTEGKVWGLTQKFLDNPFCSFHVLKIRKGGVCSKHLHNHRWNGFYIISGSLKINRWDTQAAGGDSTVLTQGEWTQIPPGEHHQFEALTDTHAIEIYWPSACVQEDIKRETQGYLKPPTEEEIKQQQESLWSRTYC